MTIQYKACGKSSGYTSCYGNLYDLIEDSEGDFDGITLLLDSEHDDCVNRWEDDGLLFNREDEEYIRECLRVGRKVGFGDYMPRTYSRLDKDRSIFFPPETPMFIVTAVTGLFRAWSCNHVSLYNCYNMLTGRGIEPYAAFCVANALSEVGTGYSIYFNGEHSVMPWTSANKESVLKFRTWKDRAHTLPSMAKDIETGGCPIYSGRDEFFGAAVSGNGVYINTNKDVVSEYGHWCEPLNHLVNGGYSDYKSNFVNIDSLLEEVKTW